MSPWKVTRVVLMFLVGAVATFYAVAFATLALGLAWLHDAGNVGFVFVFLGYAFGILSAPFGGALLALGVERAVRGSNTPP